MADRPIFPGTIHNERELIEPADTTTAQTIFTAGTSGSRIHAITCASNESVANVVRLIHNDGSNDTIIGRISIPAGSGYSAAIVSLLNSTDLPWLGDDLCIYLEDNELLKVAAETTVETSDQLEFVVMGGDY